MTLAPDGSILRRESPRPDLLVFEIRDKITKPDVEWMASISNAAFDAMDEIDMLLIFANYEGTELGAAFDAHSLRAQARGAKHVRRYVAVGAPLLARAMIEASGALSPLETKTFSLEEEKAAWAWINRPSD